MLGRGLQSLIPPSDPQREPTQIPSQDSQPVSQPQVPVQPQPQPVAPVQPAAPQPMAPEPAPAEHPVSTPVFGQPQQPMHQAPRLELPTTTEPMRQQDMLRALPTSKIPDAVFQIEVDKIQSNPDQPRRVFDQDAIKELAMSIREFGLLQPVVVTKVEREIPTGTEIEYILISGERRLLAARMLGLERIPAIVRTIAPNNAAGMNQERLELAVIENIQRENLNPIEVARSFARLQDEFRMTQREIAVRLGKSREVIANAVRLLDLPHSIQEAIEKGQISESHGRLLLTIDEPGAQERLFQDLIARHMTTRELKNRVDALKAQKQPKLALQPVSPEIEMMQQKLSSELGAPVAIQKTGETGKITIAFYSQEELQSILQKLEREQSW